MIIQVGGKKWFWYNVDKIAISSVNLKLIFVVLRNIKDSEMFKLSTQTSYSLSSKFSIGDSLVTKDSRECDTGQAKLP